MKPTRKIIALIFASGLFLILGGAAAPAAPVTFYVDMSVQTALGNFDSQAGHSVLVAGNWDSWITSHYMSLTENPDIYSLTLDLTELSSPLYKFVIHTGGPPTFDNWEITGNRSFQVPVAGIDLPVVYFNNQTAVPEPGTAALWGVGTCAMLLLRRPLRRLQVR
jgi:hypothetical protein